MTDQTRIKKLSSVPSVERINALTTGDLNDLCDATDAAIEAGGGFGWLELPSRDILERYWRGVVTVPTRWLFVARLDGVVCGTAQITLPSPNNEAQKHAVQLSTHFIVPWARGQGLSRMLLEKVEKDVSDEGFKVINLDVRETQDTAIKLYESHGFEECGRHPYIADVKGQAVPGRYYAKIL